MLEDIIEERRKKLSRYREAADPYPIQVKRTARIGDICARFSAFTRRKKKVWLTGRVVGIRDQGGIIFLDLEDASGTMQALLKKGETKEFVLLKETLDKGDFLEVRGEVMKTKRGEKSVAVRNARVIVKSIRPLPDSWYGLEDIETRLRKRYLDAIMNHEVLELMKKKSIFWETVRNFLKKEEFLEVETPVLESVPGGAEAEPFMTHHNALNRNFYLRISLELPLKKMLVAGFEKVFEIGRIFRNEGIDREHLQDYTQMECYWAYADYNDMMRLMEKMFKAAIRNVSGSLTTMHGGKKVNWGKRWKKVDYYGIFEKYNAIDLATASREMLEARARKLGIVFESNAGKGRLIDLIYKKTVRQNLIEPCFLVDPPVVVEPLAKRVPGKSDRVERFQIVALGTELGKGFSELNDPEDQRGRFEEQMALRAAGDKEAQMLNEDFLEALEYGMPPAAGFGLSERLFAIIMDKSMREAVFFPLMKEERQ